MYTIEQLYEIKKRTKTDINEHLPTLYKLATECETVAEFGVRDVFSSYAFAHARPKKLICVDIQHNQNIDNFIATCNKENINAVFHHASTLNYELEEIDMLFIDTLHSFNQLTQELELHGNKAKKYIVFHDTISFGNCNEDDKECGDKCGLVPAIAAFLKKNLHWKELITYRNNNGLTILHRV